MVLPARGLTPRACVRLHAGGRVRTGQGVLAPFVAANQDPDRFAEPEVFDIARTDNRHSCFGIGPHYCLGANLARVELQVALEVLVTRLPNLRLAVCEEELTWAAGSRVCGLDALPVTW